MSSVEPKIGPSGVEMAQPAKIMPARSADSGPLAHRTLDEAIRFADSLPKAQRSERTIARLKAEAQRTVEASR